MSNLTVYDPFRRSRALRTLPAWSNWLEDAFRWPFEPLSLWEEPFSDETLKVDVYETDKDLVVKASLPGVKAEAVTVEEKDGVLTIQASSQEEKKRERDGWYIQERRCGAWQRSLPLPVAVKSEQAKAELKDGILTVTLPKASEAKAGRRIPINLPRLSLPRPARKERKVKVQS